MSYIRDLQSYIDSIPFGTVSIQVERANRKTNKIITIGKETIRYDTELNPDENKKALSDLENFINDLIATNYTGEANISLTLKNGKITLIGIFDTKETKY